MTGTKTGRCGDDGDGRTDRVSQQDDVGGGVRPSDSTFPSVPTGCSNTSQEPKANGQKLRANFRNTDYVKRNTDFVKSYFKKVLYLCP